MKFIEFTKTTLKIGKAKQKIDMQIFLCSSMARAEAFLSVPCSFIMTAIDFQSIVQGSSSLVWEKVGV